MTPNKDTLEKIDEILRQHSSRMRLNGWNEGKGFNTKEECNAVEVKWIAKSATALYKLMVGERLDEANKLAGKSVRYDENDPVVDLDNWATPNSVITDRIAVLTNKLKSLQALIDGDKQDLSA